MLAIFAAFAVSLPSSPAIAQSQCEQIPSLKAWGGMTNARVERYIDTKLEGDWQPYLDHLSKQLTSIKKIQKSGKSAQIKYKGKMVRLSGKRLDTYVAASVKRFNVVSCLADNHAEMQVASFNNFATAAGGSDESPITEVPVNQNNNLLQNAAVSSGVLRLDVQTSCENGSTVFKVTNQGGAWPKSSVFGIYRMGGATKQVISSRRMRLKANQSSTFRIKASKNPTGELGLFVDPSWYKRGFDYDAVARCR